MLAIELVKILLGMGALLLGIFGVIMAFDTELWGDDKGNTLLILAGIALLVLFNI